MLRLTCLIGGLLIVGISGQNTVDKSQRIDCHPEPGATQPVCVTRGCIWDPSGDYGGTVPSCYYPAGTGYKASPGPDSTLILTPRKGDVPNPYGDNTAAVLLTLTSYGDVLNLRFVMDGTRYEPPINMPKTPTPVAEIDRFSFNPENVNMGDVAFTFSVKRKSSGASIWDTLIGGLLFSDQYIQIATLLPTDKVFGFGEAVHQKLKHDFTRYTTWAMFARDEAPDSSRLNTKNLYGVHPFYIGMEQDGRAHGVFILNSNAQEVTTGPAPHLVYRTIGGMLDIYFFPGPNPEDVVNQYLKIIGFPMLPAYWALGFQLSRWGYQNLNEIQAAVNRTRNAGVPLDVVFADIDYMDGRRDFTIGSAFSGLPQYTQQLHSQGLHVTLIVDPAIEVDYDPFRRARQQGANFIQWPAGYPVPPANQQYPYTRDKPFMLGAVWPDKYTAFPDFLDPTGATNNWWRSELKMFHDQVAYDGIWIDMNEPSNFGTNEKANVHPGVAPLTCPESDSNSMLDSPPYKTQAVYLFGDSSSNYLCTKTLCMLGKTGNGQYNFYDTKNLYGWSEAKATQAAVYNVTGKRGVVISRSTFASAGHYTGHWLGDNSATWDDLRTSVIGAMEFNFFGIPYVGSDICGFNGIPSVELCLRWQQMGAFHPFSRNHNTIGTPPQDPGAWPLVARAAKMALMLRYHYLPYLYSLHFEAALNGHTVLRPLFFEFPRDEVTFGADAQFLWGSAFLITPVLAESNEWVKGYFPAGDNKDELWYSIYDQNYAGTTSSGWNNLTALFTGQIPVHVRGGYIFPRQAPATTTTAARSNPFELLIAPKSTGMAAGQLYWDDGEQLPLVDQNGGYDYMNYYQWIFSYSQKAQGSTLTFTTRRTATNGLQVPALDIIEIFGYTSCPQKDSFKLDNQPLNYDHSQSCYDAKTQRLVLKGLNINLMQNPSSLTWSNVVTDHCDFCGSS